MYSKYHVGRRQRVCNPFYWKRKLFKTFLYYTELYIYTYNNSFNNLKSPLNKHLQSTPSRHSPQQMPTQKVAPATPLSCQPAMFRNETWKARDLKTILKHHPKNACKYRTPMDCIIIYGPAPQISTMKSLHDKKNPKNPFWTSTSPDRSGSKLKSCNLHSQFGFFLAPTSPHMHGCFLWIVWILSSKFCWVFISSFAHVNQSLTSPSCGKLDRALELQSQSDKDCFSTISCKINTLSSNRKNAMLDVFKWNSHVVY